LRIPPSRCPPRQEDRINCITPTAGKVKRRYFFRTEPPDDRELPLPELEREGEPELREEDPELREGELTLREGEEELREGAE